MMRDLLFRIRLAIHVLRGRPLMYRLKGSWFVDTAGVKNLAIVECMTSVTREGDPYPSFVPLADR